MHRSFFIARSKLSATIKVQIRVYSKQTLKKLAMHLLSKAKSPICIDIILIKSMSHIFETTPLPTIKFDHTIIGTRLYTRNSQAKETSPTLCSSHHSPARPEAFLCHEFSLALNKRETQRDLQLLLYLNGMELPGRAHTNACKPSFLASRLDGPSDKAFYKYTYSTMSVLICVYLTLQLYTHVLLS